MALGKNMKIDRLIPVAKVKSSKVESDSHPESENPSVESPNESEESKNIESNVSVSLDAFFDSLSETAPQDTIEVPKKEEDPILSTPSDIEEDGFKMLFKPSRRKTQKRVLIHLEGELTIKNSEVIASNLKHVFENFDHVELILNEVSEVDLTFVQLFQQFKAFYLPLEKYLSLTVNWSKEDKKMLTSCGFSEVLMIN